MDIRRAMMTDTTPPIPDAYQRVEYVVAWGYASNLDTGVSGDNDNLRFQLGCEYVNFYSYRGVLGNHNSSGINSWRIMTDNTDNGAILVTANDTTIKSLTHTSTIVGKKCYIDVTVAKKTLTVQGTKKISTGAGTKGTSNTRNIALGLHNVNTASSAISDIKIFYCKIYDNGTLIRDYIPCYRKSDNKPGFYDAVNNAFCPSTGRGDFRLS